MKFEPNEVIDERYRVESILGSGSSGTVYLAEDELLKRQMAVKVLAGESAAKAERAERFHREAKMLSQLDHPNIVAIHRYGFLKDGSPFLVLDFVKGQSLRQLLEQEKRLNLRIAVDFVRQICVGLKVASERGIVHRDLKPENIVISKDYDGLIKIIDFGLCKQISMDSDPGSSAAALTRTGVSLGTIGYMSPEQRVGHKVDWRSDIYSLACMFFEMLTGTSPLTMQGPSELSLKLPTICESFGVSDKTSIAIDAFVQRCTAPVAADRFASHDEVLAALDALLAKDADWTLALQAKRSLSPSLIAGIFLAGCLSLLCIYFLNSASLAGKPRTPGEFHKQLEQQFESKTLNESSIKSAIDFSKTFQFENAAQKRKFEYAVFRIVRKTNSLAKTDESAVALAAEIMRTLAKEGREYFANNLKAADDFASCTNEICEYLYRGDHSAKVWGKIFDASNENHALFEGNDVLANLVESANVFILRADSSAMSGLRSDENRKVSSRHYRLALERLNNLVMDGKASASELEQMRRCANQLVEISKPNHMVGLFYGYYYLTIYYYELSRLASSDRQERVKQRAKCEENLSICRKYLRSEASGIEDYEFRRMEELLQLLSPAAFEKVLSDPLNDKALVDLEHFASDYIFLASGLHRIVQSKLAALKMPIEEQSKLAGRFDHDGTAAGVVMNLVPYVPQFFESAFYGHLYNYVVMSRTGKATAAASELDKANALAKISGAKAEQYLALLKSARARIYPK